LGEACFQLVVTWPSTETSFGFAFGAAAEAGSLARSRARLSSMVPMASHSSLIPASSLGKWPQFLILREAPLREAVLAALRQPRETPTSDAPGAL